MDYSPWSEREIWPNLKLILSSKPERPRPPKLVRMHLASTPTCINFLSRFQAIKFFDDHGLQSMVRKRNLAKFEANIISETGEAIPTKIGVHAFDINPYLHEFFELILSN